MSALVVTATDTDVGKTVVAAMLMLALGAVYWKPIQCGTEDGTDREIVAKLTGLDESHFLPERYCFREPLSPHRAAELENATIDPEQLSLPRVQDNTRLIVEGAGGVLVPVTREMLQIELFARWAAPVVVCARTKLGTINHTLLTLSALRARKIPVLGIVFVGDEMPDSERTIADFGDVKRLGRLPILARLDTASLSETFAANFRKEDFLLG